jgi:hypothetical protein
MTFMMCLVKAEYLDNQTAWRLLELQDPGPAGPAPVDPCPDTENHITLVLTSRACVRQCHFSGPGRAAPQSVIFIL